jgi:RHS repeat-associated protein
MRTIPLLSVGLFLLTIPVAAAEQFIPVVNGTIGSRSFTTTVEMQNRTATDATCEFEYRSPSRPEHPLIARERVPAHKNLVSENFLGEIPTASTLRVRCSSSEVRVFSRIQQSPKEEELEEGWLFAAFSATRASRGRTVSFSTTTKVVIAEVAGKRTDVAFVVKNHDGAALANKSYTLLPYGQRIIDLSDVLAELSDANVEFRVVNGDGAVIASTETREPALATVARRMSPDTRQRFEAHQARAASAANADVRPSISEQLLVASFKAAPFREPATGLVYMRDRWYDPSTGTFLTPDRMGYRDSSNPYAFAGGDPVNKSDPTGMYQADFHFGMTAFLAREACIQPEAALRIAHFAEAPDQDRSRSPVSNAIMGTAGLDRKKDVLREWHFPKPELTTGDVVPGSPYARRRVEAGLAAGSIQVFGEGLHPFQDSWSHRGTPSLRGFAGHPAARGGMMSTATDVPWRYPTEALAAAEQTFKYLQAFAASNPSLQVRGGGPCRPWEAVSAEASEYIALRERGDKRRWLAARGIQMPESYWEDVDMGPIELEEYNRKKLEEMQRQSRSGPKY